MKLCLLFVFLLLVSKSMAQAPAWWAERGVLATGATADDFAAVNQGQLKNIAKQAYAEFQSELPGGAGTTLSAIWATPTAGSDDYTAMNIGQVKNVVKPFYDRLAEIGYTGQPLTTGQLYPWSDSSSVADDYALTNIGQVKNVFSFDPALLDSDHNGLIDSWETGYFGHTGVDLGADPDGDGLTNAQEYVAGTDPTKLASNGNGVSDGWLAANGFNPATHDTSLDTDGDGLSDAEEAARGTVPHKSDTDGDGVPDAQDGWPRDAALKQAPLPEVRYAVIRLRELGLRGGVARGRTRRRGKCAGLVG